MKVAIISDTHDNLATLDKFIAYAKENGILAVIHCGDIADGITLKRLAKKFSGQILAVFGNMDYHESLETAARKFPGQIQLFKNFGRTEIGGLKIGFCHFPETAKRACETPQENHDYSQENKFDFVFYGHTHKPWIEEINGCKVANPGTLAGMFYKAAFAVLDADTKKLELKLIEKLR